ncbi:hypothetical protein B0T13DRAFT_476325 [Neurospora crassa]|nr:hypothetical protein B0T13DRAFT_476325 [Neurospora crassa]
MVRRHLPHPIPNHTPRMRAHGPNLLLLLCRCCWMRRHPKLRRMMGRHELARRSPRRMRPRRRRVVRWRREHGVAGVKVVCCWTRRSHGGVFGCHGVPVHSGHGRRRVGGHGHGAVAREGGVGHELRLVSGGRGGVAVVAVRVRVRVERRRGDTVLRVRVDLLLLLLLLLLGVVVSGTGPEGGGGGACGGVAHLVRSSRGGRREVRGGAAYDRETVASAGPIGELRGRGFRREVPV